MLLMNTLICTKCLQEKPDEDFYTGQASRVRRGHTSECKVCILAKPRKRSSASKQRKWHLKKTYGITVEQYDAMFHAQGGRCAICVTDDPGGKGWCVDHDHETGAVRAILCNACNTGIGFLRDDPEILRTAAEYLDKWRASC